MTRYKLSRDDIKTIRALARDGVSQVQLAKTFSVSAQTIRYHTKPSCREYQRDYSRNRYLVDAEFREKRKAEANARHRQLREVQP